MELQRLSKRMAELGLCSRREADEWIARGWVFVDGARIDVLGTKVHAEQKIAIDNRAKTAQKERVTILINKPIGYVSAQAEDGHQPAVKLFTPENRFEGDKAELRFSAQQRVGLAPAGRLDIDSTGLLVLTQDGRIARLLIGADSPIEKEYLVRIEGSLDARGLELLRRGLSLDGETLKDAQVDELDSGQLRFVLREGKKRQIRRMCEAVGVRVVALKRVRIGAVRLGNLPTGKWRYLLATERFDAPA
jgi:23S rRNA pseudouridine2604 synthase